MLSQEFITEQTLAKDDIGFGLTQYTSTSYALVGGARSGNSSAGTTRLKYDIYDLALYKEDPANAVVGIVELFVEDGSGNIKGLVNIKLSPKNRKAGLGSMIIKDILDTAGGSLEIHDIKPSARGFWQKMGIEWASRMKTDGVIRK